RVAPKDPGSGFDFGLGAVHLSGNLCDPAWPGARRANPMNRRRNSHGGDPGRHRSGSDLHRNALSDYLIGGGSSINAAGRASHGVGHAPLDWLDVEGITLSASTLNLDRNHNPA